MLRARVTERVQPGVVYTTFHFPESGANVITTENSDWATNCPEYKVTAVQATRVTQPSEWQRRFREFSDTQKALLKGAGADVFAGEVAPRHERHRGAPGADGERHRQFLSLRAQARGRDRRHRQSHPKFWTPRMREKLLEHVKQHGADGLDELPRAALQSLAEHSTDKPSHEPVGGDAG